MDEGEEANQKSDDVDRRDRERASILGSAGIGAVVAALGLAKPEFLPLYTAAGGPVQLVLENLLGLTSVHRRKRIDYTFGMGIKRAGVSAEEFERLCSENPNLVQLCTKIFLAAQDAAFQGQLDGLALSLASALEDGSRVDAEILFATVLRQLERPHVRLLAQFARNPADTVLAPDAKPEDFPNPSFNRKQILMLDPGLEDVIEPLMGVLTSNGLIQSSYRGGGIGAASVGPQEQSYAINSFGSLILRRIHSQAE